MNQLFRPYPALIAAALCVAPLTASAQAVTCPADVVFTVDTSGSMYDEAAALCNTISQVQADLNAQGINATTTLWGVSGAFSTSLFPCLTSNTSTMLGSTVPGDDGTCDGSLNQSESWGQAAAVVSDRFPWAPGAVRIVVPISDEGACNGDPCQDPGPDRDAVTNAINVANDNNVFVSPVSGTGSGVCVDGLGMDAAAGTGGTFFKSTDPGLDLAGAIQDLVVAACVAQLSCQIDPQLAVNELGDTHDVTVTVTEFDGSAFVPVANRAVEITVTSGPNAGETISGTSNASGQLTLSYVGDGGAGVDVIGADCADAEGMLQPAASPAQKFWDDDCNDNGIPDTCDVDCAGFGGDCGAFADCGLSVDANADGRPDECSCIIGVESVRFADRATTSDIVASYGTTELGADAASGAIDSDGRVTLRSRALVNGDLTTAADLVTQQGADVLGTVTTYGTPTLPAIPVVGGPGYTSANLVVDTGTTVALVPGAYGSVIVNSNATLVLDGVGEYGFKRLTVNSGSTLDYDAGSALFVHDGFTWRGTQVGQGPLPFGQTGTGWTHFEADWNGAIVGPDANIRLAGNGGPTYIGAEFVGKKLLVETDTTVTCQ